MSEVVDSGADAGAAVMPKAVPRLDPPMSTKAVSVPCDGCRRCCLGDAVRLMAGDDWQSYRTEPHPFYAGCLMLAHKPSGECVYLGEDGCTIHERRPVQCRTMDCRTLAAQFSYTRARKMNVPLPVWRRGRELRQ